MKAVIVGGALQGMEAAYLALKAGWEVVVVDRRKEAPARDLADCFVETDVTVGGEIESALASADLVLPALENDSALACLNKLTAALGKPFPFDPSAYAISSSKRASERFFRQHAVPIPRSWPDCNFPLICKPAGGSGSEGVSILKTPVDLKQHFPGGIDTDQWIVQEFLSGPTYSIEVIGSGDALQVLQVTDLHMDSGYDCKRVTAPSELTPELQAEFRNIASSIAEKLSLRAIMDVEVVLHDGQLRVLEIDARLPSQTPSAVYWSSGINMVERLGELCTRGKTIPAMPPPPYAGVVYEHIRVAGDMLTVTGEHALTEAAPVRIVPDFFGAAEAITDYRPGSDRWTATLIHTGASPADAWARRQAAMKTLAARFNLKTLRDESPAE